MSLPVARVLQLGFRFNPSPLQAATYYLPRLIAGEPLHDALRPVIHRADVYGCEPGVLARQFRPAPKTDDRFFFTSVKLQAQRAGKASRAVRAAGPGAWSSQKAIDILDGAGAKVGELRKLRYKKGCVNTDWLMDEFSCCLEGAVVAGNTQLVLCKIYLSPRAASDSAARQETAPEEPVVITKAAPKRPAPAIADAGPPCPKKMRVAAVPAPPVVQPSGCPMPVAPPRPCCVPRRGVAPSSTPPVTRTPAPALPQAPVQIRPAVHPGRSPAPAPPRPCAPPQQKVSLPPSSVARACNMPQQAAARLCPPRPAVLTPPVLEQAPPTPRPAPAAASLPVTAASPDLPSMVAPAPADDDMEDLVKLLEDTIPAGEPDLDEQVHKERDPFAAAMARDAKLMCAY
ncbi:hypothetical protein ACP70R_020118 [Stipagrostis hirtigluma subsp. patula]